MTPTGSATSATVLSRTAGMARRTAIPGLCLSALLLTNGFSPHALARGSSFVRKVPSAYRCAISNRAFLARRDLGAFTKWHDLVTSSPPWAAFSLPQRRGAPPEIADFVVGRDRQFVSDVALRGRYRKAEDQLSRSLRYPVRKWPLMPLTGLIVRERRGVLQLSETIFAFRSTRGAQAVMVPDQSENVPRRWRGRLRVDGASQVTAGEARWDGNGSHMRGAGVKLRRRTYVLDVSVWGGSRVRLGDAMAVARKAFPRLLSSCARRGQGEHPTQPSR